MKGLIRNIVGSLGYKIKKRHPIERMALKVYEHYKEFTMVPEPIFVDNLKLVWDFKHVNGCVVECGVWRGGMSAGMAEMLPDREFFLFDSFEGLPQAKEIDGERALAWQRNKDGMYYYDNCRAEMSIAQDIMKNTGVKFNLIKGWFSESLPEARFNQPIAILRLDSDWYESTMDCLVSLYSKVADGGIIIFDDYHIFDGCSRAVHDFLSRHSFPARIHHAYDGIAYVMKKS